MKQAVVIYPHQLFEKSPALSAITAGEAVVYLVEEPLILTHNPIHKQKLVLHKLSMDAYESTLSEAGHTVTRIKITECETTKAVFKKLKNDGVTQMHTIDTTDYLLEQAIAESGIERIWHESPLFILEKEDAIERYQSSGRFMAKFYKKIRQDKNILLDGDGPEGGKWSFDEDNRKKIPKGTALPEDIQVYGNADTKAAEEWAESLLAEKYGEFSCWLPYTHDGAKKYLLTFFKERFDNFGTYEDAMTTEGVRLWHSAISPLLNIGLLTPKEIIDAAISFANENDVPINSLEGFVRQIVGWREFIRASYESDGSKQRNSNFFNHTNKLPESFWTAETAILPIDHAVTTALKYGYTHHIERLMLLGNFMLLSKTHPDEAYRWFMGMYLDAYDWVMVPNIYGMSQFADGGIFATKPYISGSNYIKKMSDFPSGEWEEIWTSLYWNFIGEHRDFFNKNHRLSMMPKLLDKMSTEKKEVYQKKAEEYFTTLNE